MKRICLSLIVLFILKGTLVHAQVLDIIDEGFTKAGALKVYTNLSDVEKGRKFKVYTEKKDIEHFRNLFQNATVRRVQLIADDWGTRSILLFDRFHQPFLRLDFVRASLPAAVFAFKVNRAVGGTKQRLTAKGMAIVIEPKRFDSIVPAGGR